MQASRTLSIPVHSEKPAKRENRLDRSRRTSRFVRRPDYIIGGAEGYTAAIIPVFRGFIMADSVELVARIISEVQHKIPTRHISFPSYYFGLFTRTVQTVHRPAASIHTLREKNEIDLSLLSLLETQFISPKTLWAPSFCYANKMPHPHEFCACGLMALTLQLHARSLFSSKTFRQKCRPRLIWDFPWQWVSLGLQIGTLIWVIPPTQSFLAVCLAHARTAVIQMWYYAI